MSMYTDENAISLIKAVFGPTANANAVHRVVSRNHITVAKLVDILGVDDSLVWEWIGNRKDPSKEHRSALLSYLDTFPNPYRPAAQ